ncbi:hypothetical protein KP509_32G032900 [Ceratopteris richardii]|uniref:K Homology domain-containing protein n=1 Tax=Ceratopteris richardii TaxID=49495 RepID=A0A8T2QSV2_CERRI|nr:hypothetical protein KP509_32G032900 [Ceratopteris richardii]
MHLGRYSPQRSALPGRGKTVQVYQRKSPLSSHSDPFHLDFVIEEKNSGVDKSTINVDTSMPERIKNTTFVSEEKNLNMDKGTITVDTPLSEATKSTTFVSEQTASADSSPPAPLQLEVLMEETTPDAEEKTVDETTTNYGTPPLEAAKYSTSVQVDACLLRFVVGKGGKTREKIQKDTSTRIKVPSPCEAKHGACFVVEGPSQSNVDAAVSQIGFLLEQAMQSSSLDYSHFISLPLASHAGYILQVNKFHDSVMDLFAGKEKNEDSAIDCLSIEVLLDFDEDVKASVEVISCDM